ncbi:MAG: DapH/DapD/GlmU-related protein [Oscillospiraceae bacterium]
MFFPDNSSSKSDILDTAFDLALQKTEYCFSHIAYPSYCENNVVKFNHLHQDQYCQFLYILSRTLWEQNANSMLCDKLLYLNKALHSILITYKVQLPDIFLLLHPVGTVLGNAIYNDFLVVMQNVTIEQSDKLCTLGKGVLLGAGSKILNGTVIGDNCSVGANVVLRKANLMQNQIAYNGEKGLEIVTRKKECAAQKYFNCKIK